MFLIVMGFSFVFISFVTDLHSKEGINIEKTRVYNPKLIGWRINGDILNNNSNKGIEGFVKNSKNGEMKYKFIPYNNSSEIKIKIINDKLEENNIPYGVYETQINCVKHGLISFVGLLVYPGVLTCDDNKTFIISKSTFLGKKNNNN